jgi:hypothetical protein
MSQLLVTQGHSPGIDSRENVELDSIWRAVSNDMEHQFGFLHATLKLSRQRSILNAFELLQVLEVAECKRTPLNQARGYKTTNSGQPLDTVYDLPRLVLILSDIEAWQWNPEQDRLNQAALSGIVPDPGLPLEVRRKVDRTCLQSRKNQIDRHHPSLNVNVLRVEWISNVLVERLLYLDPGWLAEVVEFLLLHLVPASWHVPLLTMSPDDFPEWSHRRIK